jgi:sugar/nucleoside kinase (ribokinase family)
VGWIVDAGTDFPPELQDLIISWNTGVLFRTRDALTTRAWNEYGENEHRAFRYLTEKKRLTADDLTEALLGSKSFHLICSPIRCVDMVTRICERRTESLGERFERPIIIWEPVPDLCTPAELNNTYKALKYVDIISPNHEELGALFDFKHPSGVDKKAAESQVNKLLARGIGPMNDGSVVVRSGKEGCFVASLNQRKWLPAYHQDASRVIDPTGGGNGFLGGFAVGLVRNDGDVVEAARWGSVAASFCIEQVGVPSLDTIVSTSTCTDELWNGESVLDRLDEYKRRTP